MVVSATLVITKFKTFFGYYLGTITLYLRYLMRMLPLIETRLMICYADCLNDLYVILYLRIMDLSVFHRYKVSFITVISTEIYFC